MTDKTDKLMYSLANVQTKKSILNTPTKPFDFNKLEIDYNINPLVGYNVEINLIVITLEIRVSIKETQELILEETTIFAYSVKDLKSFLNVDLGNNIMEFKDSKHNEFPIMLLGVSLSTMRGILIEKTKGTVAFGKMLPILNPKDFFKEGNTTKIKK